MQSHDDAATTDANDATQWLTVVRAAELEGVSVRAVQRRCQSGKYRSQRIQTPQGERLEVDVATLTTQRRDTDDDRREQRRDTSDDAAAPDYAAKYVQQLESENDFLRRALEQRDRDAAELRAALREALKVQPRQLEAASNVPETAQNAPPAIEPTQTANSTKTPLESQQRKMGVASREPRPLWKVVLGIR
jgi:hypothetical protein